SAEAIEARTRATDADGYRGHGLHQDEARRDGRRRLRYLQADGPRLRWIACVDDTHPRDHREDGAAELEPEVAGDEAGNVHAVSSCGAGCAAPPRASRGEASDCAARRFHPALAAASREAPAGPGHGRSCPGWQC